MKASVLYRIASALLLLFAAGHTVGFLRLEPPTAEAAVVRDGMMKVRFPVGGTESSYWGFYVGFGLFVTAYLLFSAVLAWQLGSLAGTSPGAVARLGWAFFGVQLATLILSWIYFPAPPVVFSALVAACAGWAAWLVSAAA
ncbi:MAG TPA: hypothetical protein VFK09_06540 [Gemmatimonadales bacterium]|jgi:hypothetical protein|nr:hypothetical protein [Gemmatimonadales bacterium]